MFTGAVLSPVSEATETLGRTLGNSTNLLSVLSPYMVKGGWIIIFLLGFVIYKCEGVFP
jgi:hypothetical protein